MTVPAVSARLAAEVRGGPGMTIVTGGQTGVDTYATLAALRAGLPVHVIFPAGFRQEDGRLTASRRRRMRGAVLHELGEESFRDRTWTCVYLSDAVLLLDPAGGSGCLETARAARQLGRPLLRPEPGSLTEDLSLRFLSETRARVVQVAGCRASMLARRGKGRGLRTDLAVFMRGVVITGRQADSSQ